MHNAVKQCFRGVNLHCGSCSHEGNQYGVLFPEARNLNGGNADICFDVARPSSSGSGDLFELSARFRSRPFTISPTTSNTGRHLGLECNNSHTVFRGVLRHSILIIIIL